MCLDEMCWPCLYRAKKVVNQPTLRINTSLSEIENEEKLITKIPKYVNDIDDRLPLEVELKPILNQFHYPGV